MTAGISPRALSLRTPTRPTSARGSALSLTCFAIFFVLDVEQRRYRFVVVYPFDAFPEKLGDAEHSDLKSVHRAHRRAVVLTNSVISEFCHPLIATSNRAALGKPA